MKHRAIPECGGILLLAVEKCPRAWTRFVSYLETVQVDGVKSGSSIVCYYLGIDAWGPVRWRRYLSGVGECIVRVYPSESNAIGISSNLGLLAAARQELFGELESRKEVDVSLCAIDLPFQDLDEKVLAQLSDVIGELKSVTVMSESNQEDTRCPIVVLTAQALLSARDWLAAAGADLVVERTRDLSEMVQNAAWSLPRSPESVHPWLEGLQVNSR